MAKHFARTVAGSGQGLLLAHGAGGSVAANFGTVIDDLARDHTVVGADYPGTGRTPRATAPLVLDDLADELVHAAVDEGLDRFAVLGYSLGTAVAVRIRTRYPDRVTALVLTAGFAHPDRRMLLAADLWRRLLALGDRDLLARFLTLVATGSRALNGLSAAELEDSVAGLAAFIPDGSSEHVELLTGVDTRAELAGIDVPALVVATTFDDLAPPWLSHELADGIPGAELVEIASGHGIGAEARDEWLGAIRTFLAAR
ncbi:alpha/beta fold hydrolase [Amycolatopsis sp. CA-230715]|uniref:alpha/beta fold hydrolase n=1 Tax=Amycolatopsis sp. CA-230715 TaxID=2745196 RepID=UPI001C0090A6|nr:alpha/beta fold hydrolase [Amycolatopsis sp. CA-230715]QWF82514.1 Putative aminoacrylate hydrolase RutD [Amycolatopsis sp. CA-230715]